MRGLLITLITAFLIIAANVTYAQELSLDSPKSAFESFQAASENNDLESIYSIASPGYRDFMIFECVFAMEMNPNEQTKAITEKYIDEAKLEELYKSYERELTLADSMAIYSQVIQNKKEMFLACMKYLTHDEEDDQSSNKQSSEIMEIAIDKNVAAAKLSVTSTVVSYSYSEDAKEVRHEDPVTVEVPAYFILVDGQWRYATFTEWQNHNEAVAAAEK